MATYGAPVQFLGSTFTYKAAPKKNKTSVSANQDTLDTTDNVSTIDKLLSEYQKSYAEAKSANEARYNQLLSDYDKQKAEAESLLSTYGQAQKSKIADTYKEQLGNTMQNLVSSGLYNTTAQGAERVRSAKGQASSEAELGESVNTQKLNILNQINQARNAVIEGRTDEYPDMSAFLNLMGQYGQYGQNTSTGVSGINTNPFYSTRNVGRNINGSKYIKEPTTSSSGFKNTRIRDGMTVLKTPSAESMRINPNAYSTQSTYSGKRPNELISTYNKSKNNLISNSFTPLSSQKARTSQNKASSDYIRSITGSISSGGGRSTLPSISSSGSSVSRTPFMTLTKKSKTPSSGKYSSSRVITPTVSRYVGRM